MLVRVETVDQVGAARRLAAETARAAMIGEEATGRAALVATEIATNLVKHSGGGSLIVEPYADDDGSGVEILALDQGPGMPDVQRCFRDGYSTTGSPGTGLGAVTRMSSRYDVYSSVPGGTVLMARIAGDGAPAIANGRKVELGAVLSPYPGEMECGDAWAYGNRRGEALFVVDGIGHGALAAAAAAVAKEVFDAHGGEDCVPLVERMHRALAPTRGAALALARLDHDRKLVRFVGVGNIAASFVAEGKQRRMVSHNGTAGHRTPRIAEFTHPFSGQTVVIMHSDGISARWELEDYPGLASLHPSVIAGVLFRDHRRARDDATVAVMRVTA